MPEDTLSEDAPKERRSIRFTPDEAWAFVDAGHTGIFTSLTKDGRPIALPVWYVTMDRSVYLSTPSASKKAVRTRRRPETSFLVESGEQWKELAAVHLSCDAQIIEDPEMVKWVDDAKAEKYKAFRTARSSMSEGTRTHYESDRVAIRLVPVGKILSWDNSRLEVSQ